MSYLIFSRKFRPALFNEVSGQAHATETLRRAIKTGRIGQAYLFSGPRGIGKTTIARILAKALNCHEGISPDPCNKCVSCVEISKSSSIDVFEIDGASNRRIEEIRDLRENVKFSPARDRFKIYIIDEVHMLTQEAFNALLKTLEEPPSHVKFIFATTAPHKIPLTIISRCQRFELRRIPAGEIAGKLAEIAEKEGIKAEASAIEAIAGMASGSMRDAQSIFDQVSCSVEGKITRSDVDRLLGLIPSETYFRLAEAVINSDTLEALNITARAVEEGKDMEQFIVFWIKYWRDMLMVKSGCVELAGIPENELSRVEAQSRSFSREEILKIFEIIFNAQELMRKTDSSRIPLEIAAAELTALKPGGAPPGREASGPARAQKPDKEEKADPPPGRDAAPAAEGDDFPAEKLAALWPKILGAVKKQSVRVHGFLLEGRPLALKNDEIIIAFSAEFHRQSCDMQENRKVIEDALEKLLRKKLRINCAQDCARDDAPAPPANGNESGLDALNDPVVKEVSDIFKVEVLEVKEEK